MKIVISPISYPQTSSFYLLPSGPRPQNIKTTSGLGGSNEEQSVSSEHTDASSYFTYILNFEFILARPRVSDLEPKLQILNSPNGRP